MKRRKHRRHARENPLGGVLLPALGAVAGIGTIAYGQYAERKAETATDDTGLNLTADKDKAAMVSRVGGGVVAVSGVLLGLQGHWILGGLLGLAGVGTLVRPVWPLEGYHYALGQGDQAPPAGDGGAAAPPPANGGPKPSGGLTPIDALNPLELGYQIGQRIFGKG